MPFQSSSKEIKNVLMECWIYIAKGLSLETWHLWLVMMEQPISTKALDRPSTSYRPKMVENMYGMGKDS